MSYVTVTSNVTTSRFLYTTHRFFTLRDTVSTNTSPRKLRKPPQTATQRIRRADIDIIEKLLNRIAALRKCHVTHPILS
jgi:hypothetical protein